jgi:hypothetical protein
MTDFLDQQFLLRNASYATDCYNSLFSQQCQQEDGSICSLSTYTLILQHLQDLAIIVQTPYSPETMFRVHSRFVPKAVYIRHTDVMKPA